ncbi:hypothetical protein OG331_49505 [Streptomyces sp. NBC_01017]|uniref:Uncharacterized protein n=1 Tax=Streptomyces sp. NBC_00180 TaxID=2903632 RepID=A0AAU1IBG7_9ACTN|nr:hypothetical protein OG331_02470 [Streptomyces sp. NBC_01017]WSV35029.1 hypothetical protein OG331_49505 [Streptomyces sp. NBC_01017]
MENNTVKATVMFFNASPTEAGNMSWTGFCDPDAGGEDEVWVHFPEGIPSQIANLNSNFSIYLNDDLSSFIGAACHACDWENSNVVFLRF